MTMQTESKLKQFIDRTSILLKGALGFGVLTFLIYRIVCHHLDYASSDEAANLVFFIGAAFGLIIASDEHR